jgi:hypothetical protein
MSMLWDYPENNYPRKNDSAVGLKPPSGRDVRKSMEAGGEVINLVIISS